MPALSEFTDQRRTASGISFGFVMYQATRRTQQMMCMQRNSILRYSSGPQEPLYLNLRSSVAGHKTSETEL